MATVLFTSLAKFNISMSSTPIGDFGERNAERPNFGLDTIPPPKACSFALRATLPTSLSLALLFKQPLKFFLRRPSQHRMAHHVAGRALTAHAAIRRPLGPET